MAFFSQSFARYPLLRCIVSAAQFAGGELSFSEKYAELIAMDGAGETTTPLRIEYDALVHFRVVRQKQLMRIELLRPLVQQWAEENGFAAELDGGMDASVVDGDGTCILVEQLEEEDMTHFLDSVAPMVAASRRTRSVSRVSATEPLPLSYCPPSPEGAAHTVTHQSTMVSDEEAGDPEACDVTSHEDTGGIASENCTPLVLATPESRSSLAANCISPTVRQGAPSGSKRKAKQCTPPSGIRESCTSSGSAFRRNKHRNEDECDGSLLRHLAGNGEGVGAGSTRLLRGSQSQCEAALRPTTLRQRRPRVGVGSFDSYQSSDTVVSDEPPILRRNKPKRYCPEMHPHTAQPVTDRTAQVVNGPRNSLKMSGNSVPSLDVVEAKKSPILNPASVDKEMPHTAVSKSDPLMQDAEQISALPRKGSPETKGTKNSATTYNFGDVITSPRAADSLRMCPGVQRLLNDLHTALPPRRRPPPKRTTKKQSLKGTNDNGHASAGATAFMKPKLIVQTSKSRELQSTAAGLPIPPCPGVGVDMPPPVPSSTVPPHPASSELTTPLLDPRPFYQSREAHRRLASSPNATMDQGQGPSATRVEEPKKMSSVVGSRSLSPRSEYRVANTLTPKNLKMSAIPVTVETKFLDSPDKAADVPFLRKGAKLLRRKRRIRRAVRGLLAVPRERLSPTVNEFPKEAIRRSRDRIKRQQDTTGNGTPSLRRSERERCRRVVRQMNSLTVYLARARACSEELRGLFLLMLEDNDV
ncbi:hypothetical protein ERJ75_000140800 [Trypanosoma vivax]|uniref:Uncharacterized protein n=1 Tax=Trypanosoma vivax (strain Y486) TaxID=1055687 RepID=G0TYD3_TRYVY|nr:hypothetical protein TRVL_07853 [Trypanosoma vivax]KAH8619721.1 hypothetical protein ERJ75_000140800 [Trypanosoma vivax]CCC48980.1 conserved hypothetical protein [Trypanosoma vivax Y486]